MEKNWREKVAFSDSSSIKLQLANYLAISKNTFYPFIISEFFKYCFFIRKCDFSYCQNDYIFIGFDWLSDENSFYLIRRTKRCFIGIDYYLLLVFFTRQSFRYPFTDYSTVCRLPLLPVNWAYSFCRRNRKIWNAQGKITKVLKYV